MRCLFVFSFMVVELLKECFEGFEMGAVGQSQSHISGVRNFGTFSLDVAESPPIAPSWDLSKYNQVIINAISRNQLVGQVPPRRTVRGFLQFSVVLFRENLSSVLSVFRTNEVLAIYVRIEKHSRRVFISIGNLYQ